ncbi:MAG: alpha/beta hydrolase [Spirochaetota bacterium]
MIQEKQKLKNMYPYEAKEWDTLFEHEYVETNGINLHIVRKGKGPLILFVHGFPEFWYCYRYQLIDFSQNFTAVAIDNRGYNQSDKPTNKADYKLEELVKDLRGVIKHLGYDSCILVAHDWGGIIAWQFAYDYPEMLDNLIILNCPHPIKYIQNLTSPEQMLKSWYVLFFQLPAVPEWLISQQNYYLLEQIFLLMTKDKSIFPKPELEYYKQMVSQGNTLTSMINYYRNIPDLLFNFQNSNMNGKLKVPVLIIWGEEDLALSKALTYNMDEYLTNFRVKYIPNCSHWVQQEQPDLVNQYIRDFITKD